MTDDLKEQIRKAQAEMATWSHDKRKSVRLEGTDLWLSNAPTRAADLSSRLIAAIEGECDGLAITAEQASKILAYLQYGEPMEGTQGAYARPVAIYQVHMNGSGDWRDVAQKSYEYNVAHGVKSRILYATRDTEPSDAKKFGPFDVTWLGPAVWAGIIDELPGELSGKKVYLVEAKD